MVIFCYHKLSSNLIYFKAMKINFTYNREKDISCLLTYGKTSLNSQTKTKVYEKLVEEFGENLTKQNTSIFIDKYLLDKNIKVEEYVLSYEKDWLTIASIFQKRCESVFKVSLPRDVTAYLTVNTRCPYDIGENYFFVSVSTDSMRGTVMHELFHFYTWYKFGEKWEQKIGKQKYNDIKEALTVLLNIEFKDLFKDGIYDGGYQQHQELRERILDIWQDSKDIDKLWSELVL